MDILKIKKKKLTIDAANPNTHPQSQLELGADCDANARLNFYLMTGVIPSAATDITCTFANLEHDIFVVVALNQNTVFYMKESCTKPYHGWIVSQTHDAAGGTNSFRIYSAFASTYRVYDWLNGLAVGDSYKGTVATFAQNNVVRKGDVLMTEPQFRTWIQGLATLYGSIQNPAMVGNVVVANVYPTYWGLASNVAVNTDTQYCTRISLFHAAQQSAVNCAASATLILTKAGAPTTDADENKFLKDPVLPLNIN